MAGKIYTKTGDKGTTALFGGTRVSKANMRVEAYGTVDELNSHIGLVISLITEDKVITKLTQIQHELFDIGGNLADPKSKELGYLDDRVGEMEKYIDEMTKKLTPLTNFILPGGGRAGATIHIARTIARRAERRVVELGESEAIHENIKRYFNRLSDLLFTMARYVNMLEEKEETIWKKQ